MDRELPEWAAQYIGIPYQTHGRSHQGADCWGLLEMVQREQLGSLWPPYEGVDWFKGQRPANVGEAAVRYASMFTPVAPGCEQLGDGILIRMRGHPFHCALVLAPGWMLHTHEAAGSCVENYHSMLWERRISGFYRYSAP
jgi:cell wall-associated NlpC family hydrolase